MGGLVVPGFDVAPQEYLQRAVPGLAGCGLVLIGIGRLLREGVVDRAWRRRPSGRLAP